MKKAACYFSLLVLLLTGCSGPAHRDTAASDPAAYIPVSAGGPTAPEENTSAGSPPAAALAAADLYRDIYEAAFDADDLAWTLTAEETAAIVDRLGDTGRIAASADGTAATENGSRVARFLEETESGNDDAVSIYVIYPDGGFICHTLIHAAGEVTVTHTRLAWLDDGPYPMPGTTPTVTYSDTYIVTDIRLEDGLLHYEYDLPGNPPGGDHDGHVDPVEDIAVRVG